MQTDQFSYTTRQAARTLQTTVEAMRAQVKRKGHYRNITPVRLQTGRLLWPRAGVLALSRTKHAAGKVSIDIRTTAPWMESRNLLMSDPGVQAVAVALLDPRDDESREAQSHLDDLHALRSWNEASIKRLRAADHRFTAEQRSDSVTLLARSIAAVACALPDEVLARAIADYLGFIG